MCQARKKNKQTPPSTDKKSDTPQATHHLEGGENTPGREQGLGAYSLFSFDSKRPAPYKVQLSVGGQTLDLEIATGAFLSVISERIYDKFVSEKDVLPLEKSGIVLCAYTGEEVKPKGSCTVDVSYEGQEYSLPLLVVPGEGPAPLGSNWLE